MNAKEAYAAKPWLKYYPEGVPEKVEIPDISVPEAFDRMADKYGSKTALIFYGKKISYKELKDLTNRFAAALAALGVSTGDTVAMYLLNCPQYVIAYFGALKAGAKVTPISPVYTSKEVKHQIEDSQAKTVICEDILYDNIEKTGAGLDNVILTSIADYLPRLKKLFGKSALAKAYSGMEVPSPEHIKE
ncbi:MAG: AMP-binding protein, partial [Deltaproteobacteria bacterium]|nr:AMP-binding protein [Deltaproteobacteria bacterium]